MKLHPALPLAALLMVTTVAVADHHAVSGSETQWFDVEKCTVCKPMAENPSLLMGVKWETHKIENGVVMTAVAPEGMLKEFKSCCKKMHQLGESVTADTPLCGFCQSFGMLMAEGAKVQEVGTGFGKLTIITSDDPAVVAKIHAHSDKTEEEMKKMASSY